MADLKLSDILKVIHRYQYSTNDLSEKFGITKSAMQKYLTNIFSLNLADYVNPDNATQKAILLNLPIKITPNLHRCCVLITHTETAFKAFLYCYGKSTPIAVKELNLTQDTNEFVVSISACIDAFVKEHLEDKKDILSITVATQGIVEQGEGKVVWHCCNLKEKPLCLSDLIKAKTGIRCFVYSYQHAQMLALGCDPNVDTEHSMIVMGSNKSINLGFFINHKIQLGNNDSYPDFSFLPFFKEMEKSLCGDGEAVNNALVPFIKTFAPIFNIDSVYFTGEHFEKHEDLIYYLSELQNENENCFFKKLLIGLVYRDKEQEQIELYQLAFDNLVDVLNPHVQKRSLTEFVAEKYDSSFYNYLR